MGALLAIGLSYRPAEHLRLARHPWHSRAAVVLFLIMPTTTS
jgi:hypothetical protein